MRQLTSAIFVTCLSFFGPVESFPCVARWPWIDWLFWSQKKLNKKRRSCQSLPCNFFWMFHNGKIFQDFCLGKSVGDCMATNVFWQQKGGKEEAKKKNLWLETSMGKKKRGGVGKKSKKSSLFSPLDFRSKRSHFLVNEKNQKLLISSSDR